MNFLEPKPIYENVKGAPFSIGRRVKVVDMEPDYEHRDYIGMCGYVVYYEYECGCGQSYPHDPMIGVKLDGVTVIQEFWLNELEEVTA